MAAPGLFDLGPKLGDDLPARRTFAGGPIDRLSEPGDLGGVIVAERPLEPLGVVAAAPGLFDLGPKRGEDLLARRAFNGGLLDRLSERAFEAIGFVATAPGQFELGLELADVQLDRRAFCAGASAKKLPGAWRSRRRARKTRGEEGGSRASSVQERSGHEALVREGRQN